jgi:hypothetical protein
VVKKLLTAVVAFRTTIPNCPSVITVFGCFRCFDFWINDLLLSIHVSVFRKRRKCATASMTAIYTNVTGLTTRTENVFSSPDLSDDLHTKAINFCGTVRPNKKGMTRDFGTELRLKRGDLKTRVRDDLTPTVRKDKRNMNMLTNMYCSPAEGNFCEHENTLKPAIVQDYNRHMGYVDKSDCIMNSYSISRRTWKWTKKLFFHHLDLSMLNSYILLTSCGSELTRDFRLTLVRDLIQEGGGCLDHRPPHGANQLLPQVNQHDLTFDTMNTGSQKEDDFAVACHEK